MLKMKKMIFKRFVRYILRQKSACFSMFIIVVFAVMAYLGINYSALAMKDNAKRYYDKTNFRDIEVVSTMLLSDEDLDKIGETTGVKEVEPVWFTSASVDMKKEIGVDVVSLTKNINTVDIEEGRMPENTDECLLEREVIEELGLKIGDTVNLNEDRFLVKKSFKICGIARHADHPCLKLHVPGNRYVIVKKEAFDLEKLNGKCMKAVIRVKGTKGLDRFSDEYIKRCKKVCLSLNYLSKQRIKEEYIWDNENLVGSFIDSVKLDMSNVRPWLVFDAWGSSSYYAIRSAYENVADMGVTFALLFVIVGALVIYSSINRMVEEDKTLIGTSKAMGVKSYEIIIIYLASAIIPAFIGMLTGTLFAYHCIQRILLSIYGNFYVYGRGMLKFRFLMTFFVFIIGMLIVILAAAIACFKLLKEPAVKLLNNRLMAVKLHEKVGKNNKKSFFSLHTRMIFRNIIIEKTRILVIVVSIAGCVALLVTGFTIKRSVVKSLDRQFQDVELYDLRIDIADTEDKNIKVSENIKAVLDDMDNKNLSYMEVYDKTVLFTAGGRMNGGEIVCGDLDKLENYFAMRDYKSGSKIKKTSGHGVYISLRTSETTNLKKGDNFIIYDSKMMPVTIKVLGVFNNYVGGQMIMSDDTYTELFDEEPENNCFLVKCNNKYCDKIDEIIETSVEDNSLVNITKMSDKKEEYKNYTSALNIISGLLTGIAAFMAGGVLYNLIYLQYYSKKRSLVVMRINGFSVGETVKYVLSESLVTHILGMIFGIFTGALLAYRIICLMEGRQLHIVRDADPLSFLFSMLVMLLFSTFIHIVIVKAVAGLKPNSSE